MTSHHIADTSQEAWLLRPEAPRPLSEQPADLVQHLGQMAKARPDDRALIVVRAVAGQVVDTVIGYAELDRRTRALAASLQARFAAGDRALLLLDNDEHYVVGFLACLYAGLVAVPVFPPESFREQHLARLLAITQDCEPACVLTSAEMQPLLGAAAGVLGAVPALAVDSGPWVDDPDAAAAWRPHRPRPNDLAFLQYTSGSTASPKGVMISHANLMANERAIEEGLSVGPNDVFVSWLPLFHDMGLIGGLLQPLHRGIPAVLMTPRFFLEQPLRWLQTISRLRGTISGGPDFAYRLCVERVTDEQLDGLDLSCWRLAFSGAEPVREDTLREFIDGFAAVGFSGGAVYPCYGLAEATLFVTGGVRGRGLVARGFSSSALRAGHAVRDDAAPLLVSCGTIAAEHGVRVVATDSGAPLADDCVGEIWARGASLGRGYWGRLRETEEAFVERDGHRWLRTGDLGFRHEGQLYVAGRLKDLIIVRGHNLYPQDLERRVEAEVEAVRKGRVAAFAVTGTHGEGIGLAAEVPRGLQKLVPAQALAEVLSRSVSGLCGEPLSVILLLNPGALPKTSSGKLQRSACRAGWQAGTLDAYAVFEQGQLVQGQGQGQGRGHDQATAEGQARAIPADDPVAQALAAIWREALRRVARREVSVTLDTHFFASGGNSLAAVQVVSAIRARWSLDVQPRLLFEHPVLDGCAVELHRRLKATDLVSGMPGAPDEQHIELLPRTGDQASWPASHAQRRQWFLWHLDPLSTVYHVAGALHLDGSLDVPAMQSALASLVVRHEALRTVFSADDDGTVWQTVRAADHALLPTLAVSEVQGDTPDQQALAVHDAMTRLHQQAFDLTQGPLWRVALLRTTPETHRLVIVAHHIVSDGTSMQVFIDELAQQYGLALRGGPAAVVDAQAAEPRLQYADHAAWQGRWLQAGAAQAQLAYWRAQLGATHPVLALPTDRPRSAVARHRAGRQDIALPASLVTALRQAAQSQSSTLFMLMLAGLEGLLFRFTGQHDVRVGVPVANRRQAAVQGVIGFFVNTLVLRGTLDGRMPLRDLLVQAREASLGAQAHQDLPFEQLVDALQPERSPAHSPLFQVMFNHLGEDYRAFDRLPGLRATPAPLHETETPFELTLETREQPDGQLSAHWVYAGELFEPGTIARLSQAYVRLLQALAETPGAALDDIELRDEQQRTCLQAWSRGVAVVQDGMPVHQLIEAQARQRPDAVALRMGNESLSYGTLDRRANRLAQHLIAMGVKPEQPVGVGLARSRDLYVALLAILKAGAAYVPLDPAYPPARLAAMIDEAAVAWLLTGPHWPVDLPVNKPPAVLAVHELDLAQGADTAPAVPVHAAQLAYVVYTSGSTGRPKGVAVAHGPLSMHVRAMAHLYSLSQADRVLQFASVSFDAAAEQWLAPLAVGATVVVPHDDVRAIDRLEALVVSAGVTVLDLPPAYLRQLRPPAQGWPVRLVIAGGEAWAAGDLARAREQGMAPCFVNAYGPSEAVITPTAWSGADLAAEARHVPIGRPVGQRTAHVLDASLNPVPIGVPGELFLGDAGLARGYLARPDLTAERFVADPFDGSGGRLYRTGDLVRWQADGQLDYLGRVDQQVKVRGFRIELAEVEASLLAQAGVREAVVSAVPGPDGLQLVAQVVAAPGNVLETGLLREALARQLPGYMVPSHVVRVDALPRLPSGKVDRQALPAVVLLSPVPMAHEPPPQGPARAVAAIWAELLKVEQVGLHDNFFDLGGHSLLLIQLQRRVQERLSIELSVMDLFQHPTVADVVRLIERGQALPAAAQPHEDRARRQRSAFVQRRPGTERISS